MKTLKKELLDIRNQTFLLAKDKENQKETSKKNSDYKKYLNQQRTIFKTSAKFLLETEAYKEGAFNLFVGRTGKGKTDLALSLVVDDLLNGYRVGIYISEGFISDYYKQIENILQAKRLKEACFRAYMENLFILGEDNFESPHSHSYQLWSHSLFEKIKQYEIKIFYFDNLSTFLYTNQTADIEANFINEIARKTAQESICFNGLIHNTKGLFYNAEITLEAIRGNSAHANLSHNIFALNNFDNIDRNLRILKILKCRDNGELTGTCYQLFYKKLKFRGFYPKESKLSEIYANRYFLQNVNGQNKTKKQ